VDNVTNKPVRQSLPTSAAIVGLDTEVVSQLLSKKDKKSTSAAHTFRVTDDGVLPTNHSTSKKLPQNNETNMVSARTLKALQKKKEAEAAAAEAAETVQKETVLTAEMTDVT
jgi:hypothetical protein